jgi:hypothetical protein
VAVKNNPESVCAACLAAGNAWFAECYAIDEAEVDELEKQERQAEQQKFKQQAVTVRAAFKPTIN